MAAPLLLITALNNNHLYSGGNYSGGGDGGGSGCFSTLAGLGISLLLAVGSVGAFAWWVDHEEKKETAFSALQGLRNSPHTEVGDAYTAIWTNPDKHHVLHLAQAATAVVTTPPTLHKCGEAKVLNGYPENLADNPTNTPVKLSMSFRMIRIYSREIIPVRDALEQDKKTYKLCL